MIEAQLPAVITVVTTAAIDSINPCAIGVMILLMSVLLAAGSTRRLLGLGFVYIFAVFATYLAAGLGLTYAFASIPLWVTEYLSIGVALVIIVAGILEIKDYFWYGRWVSLSIPVYFSHKMKEMTQNSTVLGVAFLGFFVSVVELPCTGAPYLAIITLLSQYFDTTAFLLLVLYNIIFVLPLLVLLVLVAGGKKVTDLQQWKLQHRGTMRLFIGLLLIFLGWLLILISNGTINFG